MMLSIFGDFLLSLLIGFGFLTCMVMLGWVWFHFPNRTVDDVIGYLRPIDLDAAKQLTDPMAESSLRSGLSPREFRALQHKRIYLYCEVLKRMSHNAGILVDWANREAENENKQIVALARRVQEDAIQVRAYALAASFKLRFWLAIRLHSWQMLPAPNLVDTTESAGISGLESYDRLKTAASALYLELRSSHFEELLQAL
jgi:hypothetical protein